MASQIEIRQAWRRDIAALVDLYIAFHEFHARGVSDRLRTPSSYDRDELRAQLRAIIDAPNSTTAVAEFAGEVVGFAEVYAKEDEANPCRCSYRYTLLQSMMIDQSCVSISGSSTPVRSVSMSSRVAGRSGAR
jgi:hypothetical protein